MVHFKNGMYGSYLSSQKAILMGFINNVQVEILGAELVNIQILCPSSTPGNRFRHAIYK